MLLIITIFPIKKLLSSLETKLKGSPKVVREIIYGLLFHEIVLVTKKERGQLDNLFMLVIFGVSWVRTRFES
jgi:hypothetical protein